MFILILLISSLLAPWRSVLATPTWPASTDELEDLLFLNAGYRSTSFANAVTPCSKGLQPTRVTAAEWLRTAFHDAISGNIYTGQGGLDGSIAWELDSLENEGTFADDSVAAWAPFVSDLTSLSDVIAAATYALTRSCSNISVAVRGGRVDAQQAGPTGFVPQPQNAIGIFRNQFARLGMDDKAIIQFVACGHSIGGVHGADHPEITNQDLATFDTTPALLDNQIAVEFVSNATKDPLVVGPSVQNSRNSDFRVFQADKNVTIRTLAADPQQFAGACQAAFQTMIDQVPAGTTLSDPISPYEVKPYALQLTLLKGGSGIRFTGDIRVRTTQRAVSEVHLVYTDRNGAVAGTPISTTYKGLATGFDDSFSFYGFSTDLLVNTSISSFNVAVTYADSTRIVYDNRGLGFRVRDTVIYQAPQSCSDPSGKSTIVAAVRDGTTPNLQVLIKVPQASPNPVPSISTTTLSMATQSAVGPYQLYSAALQLSPSAGSPPVFGVFAGSAADTRKALSGLPASCTTLATAVQSSTPLFNSASSSSQPSPSASFSPITTTTTSQASDSSTSTATTATPTSTPTGNFSFKGCYSDAVNPRALSAVSTANDSMTVAECAATCKQYRYFGLEYARECYCGNTLDASSTQQPDKDCSMPCGGSKTQRCGGSQRLSLYTNLLYSAPVNPSVLGYEHQGCYSEGRTTRALLGASFTAPNMTVEICATFCSGTIYFGVEYSQECYCGTNLQAGSIPQNASECNMLCAGSQTEYCGGANRLNIYLNSTAPRPAVSNPSIANYTYAGCYTDSVEVRVLSDAWSTEAGMTVQKCARICEGYTWFGTEYAAECYCGMELRITTMKVGEEDCGMTCVGDAAQFCGGSNRLSTYKLNM